MDKDTINRQYFGHDAFRPGQGQLIDAILSGRDSLGIMPTGGGKSLCYQVPALMLPDLTLVISPLISLMKDQVAAFRGAGVPAAFLNSSLEGGEYRRVCRGVRERAYKLLYIAPERLDSEGFVQLIGRQALSLIAVNEAHCISQWGQDFRPSYLSIPDFVDRLLRRPVLTAFTATEGGRADIVRLLRLRDPAVLGDRLRPAQPLLRGAAARKPDGRAAGPAGGAEGAQRDCLLRHSGHGGGDLRPAERGRDWRHPVSRGALRGGAAAEPGRLSV